MVPSTPNTQPPRSHRATTGLQVIPVTTLAQPARMHRTSGRAQVVPGGPHLHPAHRHGPGPRVQVIPTHTRKHPTTHLSTGGIVVIPDAPVLHPPGTHVPRRIKTIRGTIDHQGRISRIRTILVAVPPATSTPLPHASLRRRSGRLHVNHGARRHDGRLRRIRNTDRRITRTNRRHHAVLTDRRHGLVRRGPHEVDLLRVGWLAGDAQRHRLPHHQR